jgi:hypothetical protein
VASPKRALSPDHPGYGLPGYFKDIGGIGFGEPPAGEWSWVEELLRI